MTRLMISMRDLGQIGPQLFKPRKNYFISGKTGFSYSVSVISNF